MKKRDFILILVGVVVLAILVIFLLNKGEVKECVPASCCHADSCVLEENAPNCSGRICTMDCRPETMDCGQGYCEFVKGSCEVIWNE